MLSHWFLKRHSCFFFFSPFIQNNFLLWCNWRGFLKRVSGACGWGFPVHLHGPWSLFGIWFYLFSFFAEEMRSRAEGRRRADGVKMRGRDERMRGKEEYKRMKRRWEEGEGVAGERTGERKRTYERQEAPVGSPAEHLSLKRLLLSITVSSPLFSIHLFCLATGRTPKGGKSGCLKFLLPSCVHLLS